MPNATPRNSMVMIKTHSCVYDALCMYYKRIYPISKYAQKMFRNGQEDWMVSPSIPKGIQGGSSKATNWGSI